ncbi:hypothetical protein T265_16378 [Opisthorchis viverrini]|uniref:Uncharacterized protein n=1 Tax=Opisthorchis viverrini TaxID=6198 RepID=A0A074YT56_OPIVI|nr:hypothetical protein T265_16378 [Opisthorchis viverrini]KER17981.1 hypothetical protein T265_16378 [Opisthorchis viverrini]
MMGDDLQQLLSTDMTFVNVVKGPYWETSFDCWLQSRSHLVPFSAGYLFSTRGLALGITE